MTSTCEAESHLKSEKQLLLLMRDFQKPKLSAKFKPKGKLVGCLFRLGRKKKGDISLLRSESLVANVRELPLGSRHFKYGFERDKETPTVQPF